MLSRRFKRKRGLLPSQRGNYGRYGKNGEMKFFDTALAYTTITNSGVITSPTFNLIDLGTGEQNRIGRKVTVKRIQIRGTLQNRSQEDPAMTSNKFRVIVYQDKQCNGAAATVTDILDSADVDSFRNLQNSQRFRILSDKFYVSNIKGGGQNSAGTKTWGEEYKHFKVFIKCNIPLEFGTTSPPTIADLRSNNLGILAIVEEDQAANTPRIGYLTRLRYSDN